ncbi:hypothetical protein [Corynebacterium sp. HMSC04H06]|uniref:hypothetical protein n=1 Tax=Corynebacterium sp. HMSC04H06 TaxID=1581050 RepID=UPI0008A2FACA|nr:hypothetical protein [Corynebacterium sp. HMSC04H06]OFS22330.1 hypothetical protein HMPREF3067_04120 [Corynebacterium sp. HMSC04H06]
MPDFPHLHLAHLAAPRTSDGRPVAPGQPAVFTEPSDAIRTLSFLSNLAAQEATRDPAASMSAELALHALCGTPEMLTDLFAVVSGPVPVGELSPLGYPLLASTGDIPELDYVGFIQLSRPQLEDLGNAELDCVLDAGYLPLPGTPLEPEAADLLAWMLDTGCDLAQRLGRARVLTGMMHTPDDEVLPASLAEVFTRSRFSRRHAETQLVTHITAAGGQATPDSPVLPDLANLPGLPGLPEGWQFAAFHNYDLPADIEPQVVELLTVASQDADYGAMTVEPVAWTADRLNEARRPCARAPVRDRPRGGYRCHRGQPPRAQPRRVRPPPRRVRGDSRMDTHGHRPGLAPPGAGHGHRAGRASYGARFLAGT